MSIDNQQNAKRRLLPPGTLEDIKSERAELVETLTCLKPDFQHPLIFLTDFLKLQSDIGSLDSILDSHDAAVRELTQEANEDE